MLSDMQRDALTELVNVYIGQAASILSEMVNKKIILSVPDTEIISVNDPAFFSNKYPNIFAHGHVISSSLGFGHEFQGKAYLIFPAEQAKLLVNACLGEEMPLAENDNNYNLMDTDFDVLKEIGNIILNSIVGEFGNFLDTKLEYTVPDIELVYVSEQDQNELLHNHIYILLLHTSFVIADTQIKGVIIIALSMNSISWLINRLDEYLEKIYA